jgi:hypothetical protein
VTVLAARTQPRRMISEVRGRPGVAGGVAGDVGGDGARAFVLVLVLVLVGVGVDADVDVDVDRLERDADADAEEERRVERKMKALEVVGGTDTMASYIARVEVAQPRAYIVVARVLHSRIVDVGGVDVAARVHA